MARGISTVGTTEEEALESVLDEHPELKIVACERIDLSDIPLRQPGPKDHWAIAFEDSDPSQFIQDDDPIGKIKNEVRHFYKAMVEDPERLSSGLTEGPFTCPICSKRINLELPPDWVQRRMDPRAKVFSKRPECGQKLFRHRGDPRDSWNVDTSTSKVNAVEPEPPGKGLGTRRACIFCGAEDQKVSKEHLWSKWMSEHVEGSSGGTSGRIRSAGTSKITSRNDWPSTGFDREISGPCKHCNEGWMAALEDEAAPLLIPMLYNEEVTLRPEEQRTVARWVTLKVLVAQEGHGDMKRVIPRERYRLFYADRSLPIGAQVWIGRYNGAGAWPTNYQYRELYITMQGHDEPPSPNAYLVGFTIGYLAFLYWGHEIERGPVADTRQVASYLTQVWPATGLAKWPPLGLMEADGLEFVMKRFPIQGWI